MAVLVELGAINTFWKAEIAWTNESSLDNHCIPREDYQSYSLKVHKEKARGIYSRMTIIYSQDFAGNHDGVRNQWSFSPPLEAEPNSQVFGSRELSAA